MFTLILSVACSVAVSVLLKLARRYQLHIAQAIAVNYIVASAFCVWLLKPAPTELLNPTTPWWVLLALGVLLPTVFLAMAAAVRHAGIVLSDAAQRLSLFIPLLAAFVIFGEAVSIAKGTGILLALLALGMLMVRPDLTGGHRIAANEPGSPEQDPAEQESGSAADSATTVATVARWGRRRMGGSATAVAFLLCVWVGYGIIDILFKQMARSGAAFASSLLFAFVLAGIVIIAWLLATGVRWHRRSLMAGIVLGILNFGNIYFYIRAHQAFPDNPTLVFSAMNIGVISLGTLVGAGFFGERLNKFNVAGIVLAVLAIVLLIPR